MVGLLEPEPCTYTTFKQKQTHWVAQQPQSSCTRAFMLQCMSINHGRSRTCTVSKATSTPSSSAVVNRATIWSLVRADSGMSVAVVQFLVVSKQLGPECSKFQVASGPNGESNSLHDRNLFWRRFLWLCDRDNTCCSAICDWGLLTTVPTRGTICSMVRIDAGGVVSPRQTS